MQQLGQRRWGAGEKEEEEKLLSTKEAAETLNDKLSPRSESQSSFVRAAN